MGKKTNAEKKAKANLEALNAKLEKEVEEHQREIEQLRHQLDGVREGLESATGELHALGMRLRAEVGEKNEIEREIDAILEQRKAKSEKDRKKKWIFPAALTAILVASTVAVAVGTFCSRKN